jgi:hypothetical protein
MVSTSALAAVLAQEEAPQDVPSACDPQVFEGNQALCEVLAPLLPGEFLTRTIATLLPMALRILLVLVIAWVLHRLVRRAIRKFVTGLAEQGLERLAARNKGPLASTRPINLQRATMRT